MAQLVRKLGAIKINDFLNSFDTIVDEYTDKARSEGYDGKLVFKKEHGEVLIFVELEDDYK